MITGSGSRELRIGRACSNCAGKFGDLFCACVLNAIKADYSIRRFRPGTVIDMEGCKASFLGSIVDGVVSQEISLADGRIQGVALLSSPDVIGNHLQYNSKYTVTALSVVEVCCISAGIFGKLLHDVPNFRLRFLEMKLEDLDRARNWLTVLGRRSPAARLAYFVVRVAHKVGFEARCSDAAEICVQLPITRERLGAFLGMSTETVSREFTHLERDGVLSARGSRVITIFDYRRLEIIAGIDDDGGAIH